MTIIYTLLAIVAIGVIIFAADRDGFWRRLAGDPDLGQTDFSTLKPNRKPNEGLATSEGYCPHRQPDIISPEYALPAAELAKKLDEKVSGDPLIERVDDGSDPHKLRFVTRTPLMHFPDTMSVDVIPISKSKSTIAIHAKAQIGHSDFGNNLHRVKSWLKLLSEFEVKSDH